jgi:phosphoesterase RecJ-like protein
MKGALEQLGKSVTVIQGDSEIPEAFMHFPGADKIVKKNFFEINQKEFDLFLVQDCASTERISGIKKFSYPLEVPIVIIDHHKSAATQSATDLIENTYPATAQILFELFMIWGIKLTPDIAINLFMGMYTDTGGFKYQDTTARTFRDAAELVTYAPDFPKTISRMENSNSLEDLQFQGLALSSIQTVCNDQVALAVVPYSAIKQHSIPDVSISAGAISAILRSAGRFNIVGALIEASPGKVKASFRACDSDTYDISKLAASLGGGGHKAAAGASILLSAEDAKQLVVSKMKELYNL